MESLLLSQCSPLKTAPTFPNIGIIHNAANKCAPCLVAHQTSFSIKIPPALNPHRENPIASAFLPPPPHKPLQKQSSLSCTNAHATPPSSLSVPTPVTFLSIKCTLATCIHTASRYSPFCTQKQSYASNLCACTPCHVLLRCPAHTHTHKPPRHAHLSISSLLQVAKRLHSPAKESLPMSECIKHQNMSSACSRQ